MRDDVPATRPAAAEAARGAQDIVRDLVRAGNRRGAIEAIPQLSYQVPPRAEPTRKDVSIAANQRLLLIYLLPGERAP